MSIKLSGKMLVIQLTRDQIRIAKIQQNSGAQLICCATLAAPAGAIDDGSIVDISALTDTLKTALAAPDFSDTRRVVFSLCTTQAISEKVSVPAVMGQKLDKIIDANIDIYFPVSVSDYRITRRELGRSRDENNSESIIMQLWAIPNAILARYYALAAACGLNVLAIDYCGHSHARISGAAFTAPKRRKRIIKKPSEVDASAEENSRFMPTKVHLLAEPEMMLMTFVRDGCVQMQRSFLCGSDIDSALGEAMMVIDYYRSLDDDSDAPLEIVICGSLAEEPHFADRVENALFIPAHIQDSPNGPGWCSCIAAAQSELDFGSAVLAGKKDRRKSVGSAWHFAPVLLGGAAAILSVLLFTFSGNTWRAEIADLESTEAQLRVQAAECRQAAEEYRQYAQAYENFSSDRSKILDALRTYNDNMVLVLREIEALLPSASFVDAIDIQPDGMYLQFSCPDKEEAAYLIMTLREMEYASPEDISNLFTKDSEDERIRFSVLLAYNESLISAETGHKDFIGSEIPDMLEVE